MNVRRTIGLLILIGGIVMILFSRYIKSEVNVGQRKVASAEEQVEMGETVFGLTPATKPFGDELASPMRRKIAEGKMTIAHYQAIANWLMVGGIVCIIGGLVLIVIPRRRKS